MVYKITFRERGEITDTQKEKLLKKLKVHFVKEKKKGPQTTWFVKGAGEVDDDKLTAARKKCKISREMSNPTIQEK